MVSEIVCVKCGVKAYTACEYCKNPICSACEEHHSVECLEVLLKEQKALTEKEKNRADKLQKLYSEVDERNFKLFEKEKKRADAFRNVNTRYKNKIMKLDKLSTEIDKERAKQYQRAEELQKELDKGIKLMFDKHNEILLHQADAYILFKKLAKGLRTTTKDVNTTIQEDCGNSKEGL